MTHRMEVWLIAGICVLGGFADGVPANAQSAPPASAPFDAPYWLNGAPGRRGTVKPQTSVYRVSQQSQAPQATSRPRDVPPRPRNPASQPKAAPQHPLQPVIDVLQAAQGNMAKVKDYSYLFIKRERLNGKLGDYQHLEMKLRQKPFSVYANYLKPEAVKGQKALYVDGKNNNRLWAHPAGLRGRLVGTIALDPEGSWALNDNRHPITHAGILYTATGFLSVCREETAYGECEVKFYPGAKVDGRACTCVQVVHPRKR
ncbi:MAG: DUF1571 domain-containing protein, partial [Planctomycetales bacterium]